MLTEHDRQRMAAASSPRVRLWATGDQVQWDRYVHAHPRATIFHSSTWKHVLEDAFSYPSHYLLAQRGSSLCGVLPLFACRSIRGKRSLYSLPHTVYGGPLADDAESERALLDHARAAAASYGAVAVQYRNRYAPEIELETNPGFVTFERALPSDPDDVYRSLPKKAREAINQARKRHRLTAEFSTDLPVFYDLVADSFQRLGTPVFPRRFFEALCARFRRESSILLVHHHGEPVAGVLSLEWRGTMMPLYSGEAPGVRNLKSANFKYLRLMEVAVERRLTRFDFGRSRMNNEGAVKFKVHQGFEAEVLPYRVDSLSKRTPVEDNPHEGLFARMRPVWARLPRRVARSLGPSIVRLFP